MSAYWAARLRTIVTITVLALVVLLAVRWGFGAVTEPFPEKAEAPTCVNAVVQVDDVLRPAAITVSVLNSGGRDGLARRVLTDLADQGFAEGALANAPDDAKVDTVAIWAEDPNSPDVKLVRSYLGGKKVKIITGIGTAVGINVIVGDKFKTVGKGRAQIVAKQETTICTPPALTDSQPS